ncbi:tRNA pseudouridine65 synthase/23S rRNA pseudouridine1911/1915/1917 synthase [Christiangramia gaetbulicola]|uniref:tRNA pseudouridine65 synthase/23S rRNA pseudouridine1911/1915/1917 synthase n=1 Tax=Christiangramia gaetbulicola TaxID=703340 RepID=A0A2T6AL71_9FLAO|nr:RluA family pseudouridine synthase [Christiangramia gaetbulicola]PTX44568.1 tRNA pseudouridine65 synthase/23S rRNA pseudouridine1911/1915/1917 synthase [Christiangramia gaetbulicola]
MKILETHIVPAISEEIRLQEYAVSVFTTIQTRSGLKKAIKKGLLLIDGQKASTADWIKEGQKIDLLQPEFPMKKIFKLDLEVLFEDEHIAVVHKPAGFPTSGNFFKTIENALPHNLSRSKEIDALPYPLPAHRLDNPTAGILLCAKTRNSLIKLQQDFAEKKIAKIYFALVHGKLENDLNLDSEIEEKPATTLVKPQKFFKIFNDSYTLVEAKPLTGKTHQIRIHLSRNGHPIVGDKIYGIKENDYFKNKNLFLFSGGIYFSHPVTKIEMNLKLELPKRFRNLSNYRVY